MVERMTVRITLRPFGWRQGVILVIAGATMAGAAHADEATTAVAPARTPGAPDPLRSTRKTLAAEFARQLQDPAAYAARVDRECGQFPEGTIYPYAMPAFAYINLGLNAASPAEREADCAQVRTLIDLALPEVVKQVHPPHGDLAQLTDFQRNGTYLSMAGCMLGGYRCVGGDDRYVGIENAIDAALRKALIAADGATIASYPAYSWTFDTIPALLALRLHERAVAMRAPAGSATVVVAADGPDALTLLARHLAWLDAHASDAASHLPCSQQADPGVGGEPPRGCDLSMRVCLLALLDRAAAQTLYARYVQGFWRDDGNVAGFREWPAGHPDGTDVDSGPIFAGLGMTATGVGIGTCVAMGDHAKVARLAGELAMVAQIKAMAGAADPQMTAQVLGTDAADPQYVTGFLYGDATLFYAVTWADWGLQTVGKKAEDSAAGR